MMMGAKIKVLEKLEYNKIIQLLAEEATSNLGKEKIEQLKPSYKMADINMLLQETSETSEVLRLYPQLSIGGFRDIKPYIKRALLGLSLEPENFLDIATSISSGSKFKRSFEGMDKSYPLIARQVKRIENLTSLKNIIEKTITNEGTIADDASPKLRDINKAIIDVKEKTKNRLQGIIHSVSMQKKLQEQIVTIRNGRYVVPVKQEYVSQVPGMVHDQSASGATVFVEPMIVVELNNKLKQHMLQKKTEEERILSELTQEVAAEEVSLQELVEALTNLDVFFAKGRLAYKLKATKPIINQSKYIDLKRARHPLINKEQVVPIDFWIKDNITMVVITGPNTGGKTVTIKTIGLLTLMAQSGLFIPADEESKVTLVDSVYADIGDEQSLEQSLSTFSSHLTNIIDILNQATSNSLILLDELGAGTDPIEGAALARSILEYLHGRGILTVATTHYGSLKHFAYNTSGVDNASVEFDIATLQPTYKLLMGLPGKSNAFEISKRLGLDVSIVDNAKGFMDSDEIEVGNLIQDLERSRKKIEQDREEIFKQRQEAEEYKEQLKEKYERLSRRENQILEKAADEARELLKKVKLEAKEIIRELHATKQIQGAQNKLKGLDDNISKVKKEKPVYYAGQIPKELRIGEEVLIPKLNQKATVLESVGDNGDVFVQAGIMKINVKITDLRIIGNSGSKQEKLSPITTIVTEKSRFISPELDLRGCTGEEAIKAVEKYLDDALIAGLGQVSIIHGKGTGVLSRVVQEYLKEHTQVKDFRFGQHGEGGHGVTVVKL